MIETTYFWTVITLLSIGTMAIRFSIIAISGKIIITDRLKEIFSFIPASILPAIVAPMVFFHEGSVGWILGKERLIILILATLVCYLSKSMLATVGFGLSALYLISHIL